MSTWIYLTCECHTPRLVAEDESGQHLYDLPRIQREVADRKRLIERCRTDGGLGYFERASARFLTQHEDCLIGIEDECGERYPTTPTKQPETEHEEQA